MTLKQLKHKTLSEMTVDFDDEKILPRDYFRSERDAEILSKVEEMRETYGGAFCRHLEDGGYESPLDELEVWITTRPKGEYEV